MSHDDDRASYTDKEFLVVALLYGYYFQIFFFVFLFVLFCFVL